jgi:hypothetical protein
MTKSDDMNKYTCFGKTVALRLTSEAGGTCSTILVVAFTEDVKSTTA